MAALSTVNTLSITGAHTIQGNSVNLSANFGSLSVSGGPARVELTQIRLVCDTQTTFTFTDTVNETVITSEIDLNGRRVFLDADGPVTMSGVISGTDAFLGVHKLGFGRVQLMANNTYAGFTTVSEGTLLIFGSQPQSTVNVTGTFDFSAPSGRLGGTGTVGDLSVSAGTASAGTVDPGGEGNGTGILSAKSVTFPSNSAFSATMVIDIKGTAAGPGHDQLVIGSTGTVNLGEINNLSVIVGGGFAPAIGDTFVIIDNAGPNAVVGTFLSKPEGGTFVANGTTFSITYQGGDGNDVVLEVPAVRTWDGGGADDNWTTPANWVGDFAPQAGVSLVFPANAARKTNVNDFAPGTSFKAITLSGSGYDISGAALNLTEGLTNNSPDSTANRFRAVLQGAAGVTSQTNVLILEATNTYSGTTLVDGGSTLVVEGTQPSSPVTLNAGTLSGGGTVGAITTGAGGATIEPGTSDSAPTLRAVGDVNLSASTTFSPQLGAVAAFRKTLQVSGGVNLGNATLVIRPVPLSEPAIGDIAVIIDNDSNDPVVGTFAGRSEGAVFVSNDRHFRVSYLGGDGNDVTLTRVAPPTLSINNVSVSEGNSGTTDASFTITLSYALAQEASCDIATASGTAIGGDDYVEAGGRVIFPAGTTTRPFVVKVKGDTQFEPNETFTVNLTAPVAAAIADGVGTATILNDDTDAQPTPTPTPTATPTASPSASPSPSPTAAPASQPLNISTRLRVETGNNVMIGGFIITGDAAKEVIIRALGPSLQSAGINNAVADPVLELRGSDGELILANDNWRDTQETAIEATTIPPPEDLEAAIVATLSPGAYTAIVTGKEETVGVGLIEAYDLNQAAASQLANISTRGLVLTDLDVLIGGFILGGSDEGTRVVVRALGPSLSGAGVANPLENPTLDLRDGNGERLVFNDNWTDDPVQAAELIALSIAPTDELEAAIVRTVPPGNYTAIVAGNNGGIGVGLVEVYNVK